MTSEFHTGAKHCATSSVIKEDSVLTEFQANFATHLQAFMTEAGLSQTEQAIDCSTYRQFKHMAVLCSCMKVHYYKYNLSVDISHEEHRYLDLLGQELGVNKDARLELALHLFGEGLPRYLQELMLNAGYETSEIEENNVLFVSLLSKAMMVEADKITNSISISTGTNRNKKKRCIDAFSQISSSTTAVEDIGPFSSIRLVTTTRRHNIYCVHTSDGVRALKTTVTEDPTIDDEINLDNELKMGKQMSCHGLRTSYARSTYQNKKALLLEWANGNPLSEIAKFNVSDFFKVAREITSSLLAMHSKKICHLDLTCDHIIFNSVSNSIKIIGCGSSSTFCNKLSYNPKLSERDLRFISTEQTGRVNRDVDFRSDFYSLGIIFYRLLTGYYPFDSEIPSKLIYMHIFQEPTAVCIIDPNIPLPLSEMISKLLKKDADERYQSAKGIIHDIDLIMSEYASESKVTLAEHDLSDTVILPQKLYGRTNEYNALLSAYNRILSSSCFELVFVKGSTGMGKTALVFELNKPVMQSGMLIYGKFDYSNSEPYSALIEAVKMFCDLLALEDKTTIAKYRSVIKDAVGEEGQLLTNVIDNLKLIIGEQPDTYESYGSDAKNRFVYVFVKFLRAIASLNSPLVIALDDLQWMDLASIQLITAVIKGSIKNLMLIGLFRDNEINSEHEMANFLHDVEKMNIITTQIKLDNISSENVNNYISDALSISHLETYPLTALICKKTNGNPFFVKQMTNTLLEQEIIKFSLDKNKWEWNIDGSDVTENVLDILRQKILSLSTEGQDALKIASCLGSPFSLSSLVLIVNEKNGVEDALASGIIIQYKGHDKCCFVHDQFRHVANLLLPNNPKAVFLSLARKLTKLLSTVDLEDNIGDVTNLYYKAKDMIDENERYEVAELFQLAGEKSMSSTAFDKAFCYFESGIDLLGEDSWGTRYDFCLKLYINAAKSAYCNRNYVRMNEFIEQISKNASSLLDLVTPYILLIRMYNDKRMFQYAISTTISLVDKLGETIESDPSIISMQIEETKDLLIGSIKDILKTKEMKDTRLLSIMETLNAIVYSIYFSGNHHILAAISLKMVHLSMKHGISKYSSLGFCMFAVVLCNEGDSLSYDFGKLSMQLLEKANAKELIPMVNIAFFGIISPFFAPLRLALLRLKKMAGFSLDIGSNHFASASLGSYCSFSFYSGHQPLSKLIDEMGQCEEAFPLKTKLFASSYQASLNLHNVNIENPSELNGEQFSYKFCFDESGNKSDIVRSSLVSCITAYLFDDIKLATKLLNICKPLENFLGNAYGRLIFYFYHGLVTSQITRSVYMKDDLIKTLQDDIDYLEPYTENAPTNFLNKFYLLKAELAAIQNEVSEAKLYYEKAMSLSRKNGFVNEEGLACERASMFYFDLDSEEYATKLLLRSYKCYSEWQAFSKLGHMIRRYPFLVRALKEASIAEECGIKESSIHTEDVSVMTDILSSVSLTPWQEQTELLQNLES